MFRPGAVPEGFAKARDDVAAIRPARYRLFVDWAAPAAGPDGLRPTSSSPTTAACAGWRRVAPTPGSATVCERWQSVSGPTEAAGRSSSSLYGAPDWAARAGRRLRAQGHRGSRSRPYTAAGLAGLPAPDPGPAGPGAPRRRGAAVVEPLQRGQPPVLRQPAAGGMRCVVAVARARLLRAGRPRRQAGARPRRRRPHDLVLGELAGYRGPSPRGTGISEFVRALPDDVACAATVWSQHEYTQPDREQPDAVGELERALDERPCTRGQADLGHGDRGGGRRAGAARPGSPHALARQCAALAALLERLDADARVQAVFQFSLRDDTAYPVGLFDPTLRQAYPTLGLWRAWSAASRGDGQPPGAPARVLTRRTVLRGRDAGEGSVDLRHGFRNPRACSRVSDGDMGRCRISRPGRGSRGRGEQSTRTRWSTRAAVMSPWCTPGDATPPGGVRSASVERRRCSTSAEGPCRSSPTISPT